MDDAADVRAAAVPLRGDADLDPLLDRVGDAHLVMIGEASHGTHEFYAWRDRITRRLVADKGFSFVAVEGDWPDCRRLHRWVTGAGDVSDGEQAGEVEAVLRSWERWPTWMWANTAVADAARFLRSYNESRPVGQRIGFHGLDVYSLQRSMAEVLRWLRVHEPDLVEHATRAYTCFEPFGRDPFEYGLASRWVPETCEDRVVEVLRRLCERRAAEAEARDIDARFVAEQNAAVVAGAEHYYRTAVRGGPDAWNVRDVHMADTLDRLLAHAGEGAKGVVWAHNTHVGDARATDMAEQGMTNLGELVRERHGDEGTVLVGLASHRGSVLAADSWGGPSQVLPVPEAREGSAEALLHDALGDSPALLVHPPAYDQPRWLRTSYDHRAIGVVYHPERERWGNYVPSTLGDRYDALVWCGDTTALTPLRDEPPGDEEPETAPFGE